MSLTTSIEVPTSTPPVRQVDTSLRLTFGRVLRSEWIKLRTLRSTWLLLGSTLAIIIVFGLIAAATATGSVSSAGGPAFNRGGPVGTVLAGASFAVLIVGVMGALIGAREYGSGLMRSTLAAVPSRLPVLWAKILTFCSVAVPVVFAGTLVAFAVGTSVLTNGGVDSASWSDDGVARAVLGTAAYIVGFGLIGVSLGVLLRSIAGSISTLIAGFLFLPTLATALLPDSWDSILKYLPSNAASAFTSVAPSDALLSPTAGGLVFAAWVVAAVVAAAVAIRRRDA